MDKISFAKEFLHQVVIDINDQIERHYDATNHQMHIIAIGEKKSYSLLSPVFGKKSDWLIMDCCVTRGNKDIGFLDYLFSYKNYLFAIEVKLAHMGLTGKKIKYSDTIFEDFNEALTQLNELELRNFEFLKEKKAGLIKIALLIVVSSGEFKTEERRNKEIQKISEKEIKDKWEKISDMIKSKFNKEIVYTYPLFFKDMMCARGRKNTLKFGLYPGIVFIAHIYEK